MAMPPVIGSADIRAPLQKEPSVRGRRGFTLVEMLAAAVILAMLGVALMPLWQDLAQAHEHQRAAVEVNAALLRLDPTLVDAIIAGQTTVVGSEQAHWRWRINAVDGPLAPPIQARPQHLPAAVFWPQPPARRWWQVELVDEHGRSPQVLATVLVPRPAAVEHENDDNEPTP